MKPRSIKYYFREGVTSLFRNRLMTVASVATVAACIFIVSLSYCLISNLSGILSQIEDNIGVVAFLEDDIDSEAVNEIRDEITGLEHVTMATYISPEEALEDLKAEWEADDILKGFDENNNPLSHSFEISLDSIENQTEVIGKLEGITGVRNILHAKTETEVLISLNNGISIVGIVIVIILAVISVVIIMNTIKISVYTRKNEINIMKFVGATDWFIRWPFIIEGTLIGILGAAIPMAISWPLYNKVVSVIYENFEVIKNIATLLDGATIFAKLIPASILVGILLGVFGSASSIRKHLRV